jgi:AcrR family transcriptional regulator
MMNEPLRRSFAARRTRRIARRRDEIMVAAAQVFSEKGYANTTTKEIAHRADMAEGTLYNYFDSKRAVLLAIAEEAEAPMEAALREASALTDHDAIVDLFEEALNVSEMRLPFTRTILNEVWLDDGILEDFVIVRLRRIASALEAFVVERVEAGVFRPVEPTLVAQLVIGMCGGLILPVLRGVVEPPLPAERRALAEQIVDLLLDGIRAR